MATAQVAVVAASLTARILRRGARCSGTQTRRPPAASPRAADRPDLAARSARRRAADRAELRVLAVAAGVVHPAGARLGRHRRRRAGRRVVPGACADRGRRRWRRRRGRGGGVLARSRRRRAGLAGAGRRGRLAMARRRHGASPARRRADARRRCSTAPACCADDGAAAAADRRARAAARGRCRRRRARGAAARWRWRACWVGAVRLPAAGGRAACWWPWPATGGARAPGDWRAGRTVACTATLRRPVDVPQPGRAGCRASTRRGAAPR